MKKVLFACLLSAAIAGGVQAQELSPKYYLPATINALQSSDLKSDTGTNALLGKSPNKVLNNENALLTKLSQPVNVTSQYDEVIYSTMPVAGTQQTKSNLPVIRPGDANTHYTMLVKRIAIVDPTKTKAEQEVNVER